MLQRIRGVTIMRYINLHFTYLLTYRPLVQTVLFWLAFAFGESFRLCVCRGRPFRAVELRLH